MFPPSLQKNIRELDRQISLLEMECESMEPDIREVPPFQGKFNSKPSFREIPNKPFVTGPNFSESFYNVKKPVVPQVYSASCAQIKTTTVKTFNSESEPRESISAKEDRKLSASSQNQPEIPRETANKAVGAGGKEDSTAARGRPCIRPINSITEVTEWSEDTSSACSTKRKSEHACSKQTLKLATIERKTRRKDEAKIPERAAPQLHGESAEASNPKQKQAPSKSSEEEASKYATGSEKEERTADAWMKENARPASPLDRRSPKRRARSVRTRKNSVDDTFPDGTMEKPAHEKEIQCVLWNEEQERAEFLVNLKDSIRSLNGLIGELKKNSPREKPEDPKSDSQNTLLKINSIKSVSTLKNPLDTLASLTTSTFLEGENNSLDLRKALFGVKQFCEELADQKMLMSDELTAKNRTIVVLEAKEREYLSLIASLKFNLEKVREEAEEGARAKRDLKILQNKLEEETKVIEALKKSHGKMQELVESYVLVNDKLRTQVKIGKLESQKYNILLAGKEVEINRYKQEIQSFQRQITQQLNMLRSKASENEVEKALETLSNQTNILRGAQVDSCPSGTTIEPEVANRNITSVSTPTVPRKFSRTLSRVVNAENNKNETKTSTVSPLPPKSLRRATCHKSTPELEAKLKDTGYKSCKSEGSNPEIDLERSKTNQPKDLQVKETLEDLTDVKSSTHEMLENLRIDSSERFWPSTTSFITSQCSIHSSSRESTSELS